jgi:hypothetical protein
MMIRLFRLPLLLLAGAALGSCGMLSRGPGSSMVELYNHSGRNVLVEGSELRPDRRGKFQYPARDRPLMIFWHGCVHTYIAPESAPGGFRSTDWMFRGAYRAQLEPDGRLYLVPPGADLPADPGAMEQPEGFPLAPREGSTCLD